MKLRKKIIQVTKDKYPDECNCYEVLQNTDNYNDTRYVLRPSKLDSTWSNSIMGEELVRLQDDGNGVEVCLRRAGNNYIEYDELYDLFLLLGEYFDRYGTRVQTFVKGKRR